MPRAYHKVVLGKSTFEIDTRYQNLVPIGKGAYGLVASADDTLTGRKVAIKKVSRVYADLTDAKRILREVKLLRHLGHHENLVGLLDVMTGPPEVEAFETLYIVTQLYEADVHAILQSKQPLTDQHSVYFIYQILRGLKYIHSAQVLHRDLKPSNLLVNANCDLAICDFGLARGFDSETEAAMTEYVVTRWYRAPELLCDAPTYDTSVDVWSVGCILAEVLRRKPFFRGGSTREQLQIILQVLGTPTDADMAFIDNPRVVDAVKGMGSFRKQPLKDFFPGANPQALDLLERMLVFNPAKRITVEAALNHPYVAQLHQHTAEPTCTSKFDFSFEVAYGGDMPQKAQQACLWEVLGQLRGEQRKQFGASSGY